MRVALRKVGGGVLAAVLALGLAPAPARAYASDPVGPTGWVPDGPVLAIASAGDRVFVGGAFTGGLAALDADTGALLWTGDADGAVRALAVSADRTHLIAGGAFTHIGGARHRRLASVQVGDGSVEPDWRASAGAVVRDLVVQGGIAYFGGQFAKHDGLAQRGLGAVSVGTGEPVPRFDVATDRPVYALAAAGGRLFLGGKFTLVDGEPRSTLASVTLEDGSLDAWQPAPACGGCNVQWDVLVDDGTVFSVGRNAGAVVAHDAVTAARQWRTTANGDAQALALEDGLLYAGGHFVEIGQPRQPRTIVAALDPTTGEVAPDFAPRFVTTFPGVWALHATDAHLYVGGYFTGAGPGAGRFPYFAMFS